jgi:hypothetical protein
MAGKTTEQIRFELEAIALETATVQLEKSKLELEQTKEAVAEWKGVREQRQRTNQQRQSQLRNDREEIARIARRCSHRQGGSPRNPYGGKGQSALNIVQMPDNHTQLVTCSICRLRVFSPNERDMAKNPRPGESKEDAKRRVEKYLEARAEFDRLIELANDKLTPEAAAPMHCGITFTFMDGDGREVLTARPCDSYAQGLDNRAGARA